MNESGMSAAEMGADLLQLPQSVFLSHCSVASEFCRRFGLLA